MQKVSSNSRGRSQAPNVPTETQLKIKLKAYNSFRKSGPMQFVPRHNEAYDSLNSH